MLLFTLRLHINSQAGSLDSSLTSSRGGDEGGDGSLDSSLVTSVAVRATTCDKARSTLHMQCISRADTVCSYMHVRVVHTLLPAASPRGRTTLGRRRRCATHSAAHRRPRQGRTRRRDGPGRPARESSAARAGWRRPRSRAAAAARTVPPAEAARAACVRCCQTRAASSATSPPAPH